jgi:nitroreductase
MREPAVTELVGLPEGHRIAGIVSLGYPAEVEVPHRRRPAAELTRWMGD